MSNERHETVADVLDEMRQDIANGTVGIWSDFGGEIARSYANRIEAAHKREVAELRECLKMAVVNTRIARTCYAFGRECDNCGQSCNARKWNKVIEDTKGGKQ